MPHPEQEHGLMIEVARLRRECDALHTRAVRAETRADRNAKEVAETLDALSKATDRTVAAQSALAAARRECHLLRARFEKVAEFHEEQLRLLDSEPAKEWAGSDKTGYYAAWKTAHTVAAHEAREALDAPASAADRDPVIEEVPPHLCGGNNCEECGGPGSDHADTCSCVEVP